MPLVNLTKHPLRLLSLDGEPVEIAPDARHVGLVAMGDVEYIADVAGRRFAWSIRRVTGFKGLPEPEPGTRYVVPAEVAMALAGTRPDVAYVADTADHPLPAGGTVRVSVLRHLIPVSSAS
ncbi:MAG: hypothetical protein AAF970_13740 [Bacteroidota bacterium]